MQSAFSPFTVHYLRGGHLDICRASVFRCLSHAVLLVDHCRSIALYQRIFADSFRHQVPSSSICDEFKVVLWQCSTLIFLLTCPLGNSVSSFTCRVYFFGCPKKSPARFARCFIEFSIPVPYLCLA